MQPLGQSLHAGPPDQNFWLTASVPEMKIGRNASRRARKEAQLPLFSDERYRFSDHNRKPHTLFLREFEALCCSSDSLTTFSPEALMHEIYLKAWEGGAEGEWRLQVGGGGRRARAGRWSQRHVCVHPRVQAAGHEKAPPPHTCWRNRGAARYPAGSRRAHAGPLQRSTRSGGEGGCGPLGACAALCISCGAGGVGGVIVGVMWAHTLGMRSATTPTIASTHAGYKQEKHQR